MKITSVLFDLDGTLLPMDQDLFTRIYFKNLAALLAPHGYDPQILIKAIWASVEAMVKNDGRVKNETAFWNSFSKILGEQVKKELPLFEEFYRTDFNKTREACGFTSKSSEIIHFLHDKKIRTVLATNPLFPAVATQNRIRWAGLNPEDFELVTTYENSGYCKPNPMYYVEILNRLGLSAEECIMVGNDATEDMIAETLGLKVFLLTDCLLNRENKDISVWPHGNFSDLLAFLRENIL